MATIRPNTNKSPSRSPNPRRPETPLKSEKSEKLDGKSDKISSDVSSPTKSESPRPPSSRLTKKFSQSESKTVDIAATRSSSKLRKSISSRLSTPRINQMAPGAKEEVRSDSKKRDTDNSKRSSSIVKSSTVRSARSVTPANKSSNGVSRSSIPLNKTTTPSHKIPKATTPSGIRSIDTTKPKGPTVRKSVKSPVGSLLKKDSKDETRPTTASTLGSSSGSSGSSSSSGGNSSSSNSNPAGTSNSAGNSSGSGGNSSSSNSSGGEVKGLSRAQKAEEKHRRRVTLAQGAAKGINKGLGTTKKTKSSSAHPGLHRRSSISRAQSLAYIAKTRAARSSTQAFSNVEGDEAMAMADAIMGAIGTSQDEEGEEEEEDRVTMMKEWQENLQEGGGGSKSTNSKGKSSKNSKDEADDGLRMVKKNGRVLPSFAHMQAGSPVVKTKKQQKQLLEAFKEDNLSDEDDDDEPQKQKRKQPKQGSSSIDNSQDSTPLTGSEEVIPRSHRSATTGDEGYQKAVSNALKTTGPWGRVKDIATDIATNAGRKARSVSVAAATSSDLNQVSSPPRKGITWTFIDDAMEALSPSRRNQHQTSSPNSPISPLGANSALSPKAVEDWTTTNEDALIYQGWLQVHENGSLFSSGWRRRYLMLIRGGRQGAGPRGLGSLLILRKEPTPLAIEALVKPKSGSEANKDLCKEISLRGADLALHYEKVPAGTFGFLLTHTLGGDLPLTAPTREVRQLWLTELRNVLKRKADSGSDRELDKTGGSNGNGSSNGGGMVIRGKGAALDGKEWERERSAVSMPRSSSASFIKSSGLVRNQSTLQRVGSATEWKKPSSETIRSPLTSEIASPRNAPNKSRPSPRSLQVDVDNVSDGDMFSSPVQSVSSPGSSIVSGGEVSSPPGSPSSPNMSFRNGNDRSRSAPSQRPPGNSPTQNAMNSPKSSSSSLAVPLQWRERMRRAAPARIEEIDWDNLVAVATPDDFKDLGKGAGVSSVIVANTGGAVFFAFFRNRPGRQRRSDGSGTRSGSESAHNNATVAANKLLSKSISTVEESDEKEESDDESSRRRSSSVGQGGAIRSKVRAKNSLAKGPSVRSSRNSSDIEKLANFGDLDLNLHAQDDEEDDDDLDSSTIMEREEDNSEEEEDNEDGVLMDTTNDPDEEEDYMEEEEEVDLTEQVCILKFCRNLMDTQAEFCANQMAMALHIQVPSCRIMRKKDEEWDQIAAATFELRRSGEEDMVPWSTSGCDALEASLHDTSCGLVFELVHTGCSLKLEHITQTLQLDKDREDAANNMNETSLVSNNAMSNTPPTLQQMRNSSQSSSFMSNGEGEQSSRLTTASAVEALHLDPIRLGLPASTSFQSPPIAAALTGGVFNHRRQTLISSGASTLLSTSNSMRESFTDRNMSHEEERGEDFREEYLEKAIGEIVGETLIFDIMIRNPDRFPCTNLGWRGNLDNVMWVERSPFSGTRTLWVIDSSIPRRPLRLHVRDDKTAIPNLIKQALLGEVSNRREQPIIHPDDVELVDMQTRATSCLLYALVGGDPNIEDENTRRDLLLFDKQVPAFRRGIRRSLHRCRVLLEKSLAPLHTTLQTYFDEISIELESLAKKTKEKVEVKEEEKTNKETFANVATAAMKKAEEEKPKSSKSRPGGGFRQRFNTGDVRMFNLKKEEREALDDSDEETVDSANGSRNKEDPPPPPPPPKATERLTPVISQMGKKWATEAKNRDRSGSKPLEMLRSEVTNKDEEKQQPELNERDATVIVINNWTRKFWEAGKALEAKFEEYAIAQMDYEQQLLAASEQLTEKQQELLDFADLNNSESMDGEEGRLDSLSSQVVDNETAMRAASLAEVAAATTELMRHEPEPVFVTGFIDSGSTNCFAGAYELKIRLEHVNNRLRIMLKTLDVIGDEDEEWE